MEIQNVEIINEEIENEIDETVETVEVEEVEQEEQEQEAQPEPVAQAPQQLFPVSPAQKRELLTREQQLGAQYSQFNAAGNLPEWFAKMGHLHAMYKGFAPYEPLPGFVAMKVAAKEGELLKIVDFYVDSQKVDLRTFKNTLEECFEMVHKPHAQKKPARGRPDYMKDRPSLFRFKVWQVTQGEISQFLEANGSMVEITDVYVWKERELVGPQAETTLPMSKARKAAIVNAAPVIKDLDAYLGDTSEDEDIS